MIDIGQNVPVNYHFFHEYLNEEVTDCGCDLKPELTALKTEIGEQNGKVMSNDEQIKNSKGKALCEPLPR